MYSITGQVTCTLPYVSMFSSFPVDEFLHASTLQNGLRIQACCSTIIPKADDVHSTFHNVRSGHVVFFFFYYCRFPDGKISMCFVLCQQDFGDGDCKAAGCNVMSQDMCFTLMSSLPFISFSFIFMTSAIFDFQSFLDVELWNMWNSSEIF